jgi:hypothetical protein
MDVLLEMEEEEAHEAERATLIPYAPAVTETSFLSTGLEIEDDQ